MTRVLLTGMSGTGKSTLIGELAARGYRAVDTDSDDWCEWVDAVAETPDGPVVERDWVWREERIAALLAAAEADGLPLFVSGCKTNQGRFYPCFDHIVLLSAPAEVIVARLATRTTNAWGKRPEELARVLRELATVEPLLRRGATLEIDTTAPVAQVVATLLARVLA